MPLPLSRMSESDLVNLEQFRRKTPVTADSSESGSNSGKNTGTGGSSQSVPNQIGHIPEEQEYRAYSVTG